MAGRDPHPRHPLPQCIRDIDRDLEIEATDRWLKKFTDQRFSLADAVSFEIMRRERIGEALALDHHFEVAGYRLLPAPRVRKPARGGKKGRAS